MNETTKHYGRIVRNSRQYKGLTIREGSELCDLSPQGLSGIELGDSDPKLSNVLRIAVAFDIDLGALNDCKLPPETTVPHETRRVCRYVVTSQAYVEDGDSRIGYGIAAMEHQDDEITVLAQIDGVTCDKTAIQALAHQCTALRLDPIHLRDIVEDFLDSY